MPERTITRNVETDVDPDVIFEILRDPKLIPQWAHAFADTVEFETRDRWRVSKGGSTFSLQAVITRPSRTVDYLRELAPGQQGGAYIRVLPRPDGGSVIVMTLPITAGGDPQSVAATLDTELKRLVNLGLTRARNS